jgi:hypothetical protein
MSARTSTPGDRCLQGIGNLAMIETEDRDVDRLPRVTDGVKDRRRTVMRLDDKLDVSHRQSIPLRRSRRYRS